MTRIMPLDESTRVNMLDHALRGFPTTRGPDNVGTVCEIAALSSTDPEFIGTMLSMVPNPKECLPGWTLLAMRSDHEVMMTVLADRFGLDWATAKIPSRWFYENGTRDHHSFEHALLEHDAVRMFTTAVERGWCTPGEQRKNLDTQDLARPSRSQKYDQRPWLVRALAAKAAKLAEQLMTYDEVAQDPHHLTQALQYLSTSRHEMDGQQLSLVKTWWTRLVQAGADPWLVDGQRHQWADEKSTTKGPTAGHRMLVHAINQLADQRFHGEGRVWMQMLNETLVWSEAPVVDGQSLAAFAFAHPKFGVENQWNSGSSKTVDMTQRLMETMARQGTSLAATPAWNPVDLLLRPHLMSETGKPFVSTSPFASLDNDKTRPPSLFDQMVKHLAPWHESLVDTALDGPATSRLAQRVMDRTSFTRWWAERPVRPLTEEIRREHHDEWLKTVETVHGRLHRLDTWVTPAVRPAWQNWVREWYDACITWPDVPDDQVKAEGPRRAERLSLTAVFLITAETPLEPRPRARL